jgi:REP element-mobilizing transposase RayT
MSSKYKIDNHQALHFTTFATVQWVDALSRPLYKDVIVDSMKYCQKEKGLLVYAWCIMSNHIHLIASAKEGYSLSDILRDFKKFTSKQLLKEISENGSESKRDWMLWIFRSAGQKNTNNKNDQFLQQDNRPVELSTNAMIDQRLDYIPMNPVKECIVYEPEHYVYFSARDCTGESGLIDVEFL